MFGETVYLYGDVIYSQEDLRLILEKREVTTWFGRIGDNSVTGKRCDELMGVHVVDYHKFEKVVWEITRQLKNKERKQGIGWDVYEVHEGLTKRERSNFVQLSNYTDDFDTQAEYKNLLKCYNLITYERVSHR